ncbi:MAG: hydrogenase nickel incorporation protein HypB [bacterium]|nr:hydrogenase nickel incorporation protein HypB [bacterium]
MAEIKIIQSIMKENDRVADDNRQWFDKNRVFTINIMSSPGSGKTTILEKTVARLKDRFKIGVIEGDIYTSVDADRLRPLGIPLVQINTGPFGGECHLSAAMIRAALDGFTPGEIELLFVENVGNLVCPAEFELGVERDVAILSITEGEDKPLKYPLLFRRAHVMLLSKIDLLPHLQYDQKLAEGNVKKINPKLPILPVSAKTGEGFDAWIDWIVNEIKGGKKEKDHDHHDHDHKHGGHDHYKDGHHHH